MTCLSKDYNDNSELISELVNSSFSALEISSFANKMYNLKCEKFHEDPRPFTAFIMNIAGELQMVSFACSPPEETDVKKLKTSKSRNKIIHKHPFVLARRGFIRYLMKEVKRRETDETTSIFMLNEEGELELQPFCHVYMYTTLSYVCENVFMGLENLKSHDTNHCIMNKMRRWNLLGVQGALLSNIISPVYISKVIYGTTPPVAPPHLWSLLVDKLDIRGRDVIYEDVPGTPQPNSEDVAANGGRAIVWWLGLANGVDVIEEDGRLMGGNGSSVCKEEVFKAFLQLKYADKRIRKYSRAKKKAAHYQSLKRMLYKKWESEKNGKWLRRPSNKADKFWVELNTKRASC